MRKRTEDLRQFWSPESEGDAKFMVAGVQAGEDDTWNDAEQLDRLKTLLTESMPPKGFKVVDFGCGIGRIARALDQYGCSVIGVDVSEEMLGYAKEYCKDTSIRFIHSDGHGCSTGEEKEDRITSGWADLIVTAFVFQHMPSRDVVYDNLKDFHRVLRLGGRVVIQTNTRGTDDEERPACYEGVRLSSKEFGEIAEKAGFNIVEINDPYGIADNEWMRIVLQK
jgi:cyclopropane fatty-acyl-phospholipid synthase-like methyltransferase